MRARWFSPLLLLALLLIGCGGSSSKPAAKKQAKPLPLTLPRYSHSHAGHGKEFSIDKPPPRAGLKARHRLAPRPVIPRVPNAPAEAGKPWTIPYADSFAVPIGSGPGQDASWKANEHDQGCCSNSNEIDAERPSHVRTGEHGLEATCTKEANAGKSYTCGGADGNTPAGFKWKWGGGQTFAFQTRAKWPPASFCGEDPGWWASDPPWHNEIDFFEGWDWDAACKYSGGVPVWIFQTPSSSIRLQCSPWEGCETWVPDPDGSFHTYTTIVYPDNTIRAYIDGREMGHIGPTGGTPNSSEYEHLIVTHALRERTVLSGESVFAAEYTAVYELGTGNTQNAHIAPGTVIEGKEPTPPPPPTTETTPPPPPPPPAGPPPSPIELTAKWNGSTTSPAITISAPPVPGATGYYLYRAGPNSYGEAGAPWGPSHTTPSFSNGGAVKYGDRECYWLSAFNSHGQSPLSREVCARAHA